VQRHAIYTSLLMIGRHFWLSYINNHMPNPNEIVHDRELRANIALWASIFGSIGLTLFAAAIVYIMWQGDWPISTAGERIATLGKALMLSLGGSLVVLITLGFAINHRSVKVSANGFEASGGDDDDDRSSDPEPQAPKS
jgi:hypothetical protein